MSVAVVSTGPDATAGSTRMRRRSSATVPPMEVATKVLSAKAAATTPPKHPIAFPQPSANAERQAVQGSTLASCHHTRSPSRGPTTPNASSRMRRSSR